MAKKAKKTKKAKSARKTPANKARKKSRSAGKSSSRRKTSSRKSATSRTRKGAGTKKGARKSTRKGKEAPRSRKKTSRSLPKRKLTPAQRKEFRAMLLAKRRDILGDMDGISGGEGAGRMPPPNLPTHPADVGSDNYEQEFTLGLLESERALLEEINDALDRLKEGTFGICLATGKPISLSRLRARPWAKYCIEYARLVEKGLVRPGEPPPPGLEDELEADEG